MADLNFALDVLGASASANRAESGYPPGAAIDGDAVTRWFAAWAGNQPTLTIDLGSARFITSVHLVPRSNGATGATWTLACSSDGTNFTTIQTGLSRAAEVTVSGLTLTRQYWRLTFSTWGNYDGGSGFYTVECLGPTEAPPPVEDPSCASLQAWLDGLEANWVPCVAAWLANNP